MPDAIVWTLIGLLAAIGPAAALLGRRQPAEVAYTCPVCLQPYEVGAVHHCGQLN